MATPSSPRLRAFAALAAAWILASPLAGPARAQNPEPPAPAPAAAVHPVAPAADQSDGQTSAGNVQMRQQDLSPWGMFRNADVVVKAVMIGLAFASLATWTV